ncbi:MAG TPA: four-helix bundle copper-binding protein [Gemmataceae bacterium]|jgi:hypothetical protein|nr:four-helix bundle copper-binding protein [Gemmataceae bacterium]
MSRRTVRGALGAALIALAALTARPAPAQQKAPPKEHAHNAYADCAKACAVCMLNCDACFHHCARLVSEGKKDHVASMNLCNDCGEVCATAGRVTARQGPLAVPVCQACAKSCDTCAASCAKFPDDKHMTQCAKACRDCAKACRAMVEHAGHK